MATNNKMQNIPRWMTQGVPSVGSATNQLQVVTPDDLQTASQMYGQVSSRFFGIAENMAQSINFIRQDKDRIMVTERVLGAKEDIDNLMSNDEIVNDDKLFKKAIEDIADKRTEDMGYFTGGRMRYEIINEIGLQKRLIVSQNKVNIDQEKTRLDNKNLLYKGLHEVFMNPRANPEQKLTQAIELKNSIYKNTFLYSPKMHNEAEEKIQKLSNTQEYIDGRIDTILDKSKIDYEYLNALVGRQDAVDKAEKLQMTFNQTQIYSEIKNKKEDAYSYYQQNRNLLDRDQRKDLDTYFNVTRGKALATSEWKSKISSENLLNTPYDKLVEFSRGDSNRMVFLLKEQEKQKRVASNNKDIISSFNNTLGLVDVEKITKLSPENLTYTQRFGIDYKDKIRNLQNKTIQERDTYLQDPNNAKSPIEAKAKFNDKELPRLLNIMKEEVRQLDAQLQNKRNSLVEKQNKLKR